MRNVVVIIVVVAAVVIIIVIIVVVIIVVAVVLVAVVVVVIVVTGESFVGGLLRANKGGDPVCEPVHDDAKQHRDYVAQGVAPDKPE